MNNRNELTQPHLTPTTSSEESSEKTSLLPSSHALIYLNGFNEEKLAALEKKYHKTREQLDEIIGKHINHFRMEQILNYAGLSTNFLYMFFRGETSNEGIENVAKIFQPDTTVSDAIGYGLGVSLAIPGTLVFVFAASARNEAALAVLEYAMCDPLLVRIKKELLKAAENKMQALMDSIQFVANKTVLSSTYATSAMSNIIPIIHYLNKLPDAGKWSIILLIQYFTFRFNSTYYDESYYKGLQFWRNEDNRPYLLGEMWRGNIAIPLEIFLQGIISAAGLRAFPNYYYSALAASSALGGWIPATIVTVLAAIHSLCVLYPTTYNHYMTAHEEINAILKKNIPWDKVNELLKKEKNLASLDKEAQEKLTQKIIDNMVKSEREKMSVEVRGDKGQLAVFKEEPATLFTVSLTTVVGGILGYKLAPLLVPVIGGPPALIATGCTVLGAGLIGGSFFKAEDTRVNNQLILKHLNKPEAKEEKTSKKSENGYEKTAEIAAALFVATNAASNITSTSGSGSLIGGDSPQLNLGITSLAIKSAINNVVYNYPKVKNTLLSFAPCTQPVSDSKKEEKLEVVIHENYFSLSSPTLFSPKQTLSFPEKTDARKVSYETTQFRV